MKSVVVVLAAAACTSAPKPAPTVEAASFPAVANRDLDVLLLVDDSNSTLWYQQSLAAGLPVLVDELTSANGTLPNLHIGVTTSDFGTTGSLDYDHPGPAIGSVGQGGCTGHGRDGALLTMGAAVTGSFVVDTDDGNGGRTRDYDGALTDVLGRMVMVGAGGCGFEQHLAATQRALTNPANVGFLRASANLAIILIGDEDDCSIRDAGLVDPNNTALGDLASFRCTSQGVECDQDINVVGAKTNCHPRADSQYVDDIAPFVDFVGQLKGTPDRVVAGGIFGPPEPFAVELRPPPNGGAGEPGLAHVCSFVIQDGTGSVADPAPRLAAFFAGLASHGTDTPLCQVDLTDQLREVGRATKQLLGIACLDTTKLAVDLGCTVDDVHGSDAPRSIPACPSSGDCFALVADPTVCPETADHLRVEVTRVATPAPDTFVHVTCRAT